MHAQVNFSAVLRVDTERKQTFNTLYCDKKQTISELSKKHGKFGWDFSEKKKQNLQSIW